MNERALARLLTFTFAGLQILWVALFAFLSERLGLELPWVVTIFGAGTLLFFAGSPFWVARIPTLGHSRILTIGGFGLLASFGGVAWLAMDPAGLPEGLPRALALLLSRVIYGLTASAIAPVAQALHLSRSPESGRLAAMQSHSLSLNAGRACSLALLLLVGTSQEATLRLLAGCTAWVAAVAVLRLFSRPQPGELAGAEPLPGMSGKIRGMNWCFGLALLFAWHIETLNSSFGGRLSEAFALDGLEAGRLMARLLLASSLIVVAVQAFGPRKRSWRATLAAGIAAFVAGTLLLADLSSEPRLWAGVVLLSLGIAWIPPSYLTALAARDSRGSASGWLSSIHTLGYALGGLTAGAALKIEDRASAAALIVLAAMIAGAGTRVLGKAAT